MVKMKSDKRRREQTKREFLLTFFPQTEDHYEEKELNGFWLVKFFDGTTNRWLVGIYTQDSFKRYKEYSEGRFQVRSQPSLLSTS